MEKFHLFDQKTTEIMKRLLEHEDLNVLFNAVEEKNKAFSNMVSCFITSYQPTTEEVMTILLFALSRVKLAKQFCKKIQYNHLPIFLDATKSMIHPFCMCSYEYAKRWNKALDQFGAFEDPEAEIFDRVVYMLISLLHIIGDISSIDKALAIVKKRYDFPADILISSKMFPYTNELKQCVVHLLTESDLLIELTPMKAIQHLAFNFGETLQKNEYNNKACVAWSDVISKIDKSDNLLVIKDFLDRAIKATIKPIYTQHNTISYLDTHVESLKKITVNPTAMQISGDYVAGNKNVEAEIQDVHPGSIGAQITPKNNQ